MHKPPVGILATAGQLDYRYVDTVGLAGHSCPTVETAYVLGYRTLGTLYPDQVPERCGIRIEFSEAWDSGVTGIAVDAGTDTSGLLAGPELPGLMAHCLTVVMYFLHQYAEQ